METGQLISLLTAFGLGSIVTAFIQSWLHSKGKIEGRSFEERKKAYLGLLEAYHMAAVDPSDTAAKNFAFWQLRCDLVAPKPVRVAIEQIVKTNDDIEARYKAHEKLKYELRKDLAITAE